MAVLALGLVGSAIGGAIGGSFLGIAAASWGFALGEAASNFLYPQKSSQEGPRVGDLSVQASTYGVPKPILFGTLRVAGNVIFCTDKREVKNTQTHGGKGGPKVTTTTYTYNVDIAIALCEGPIFGIRKIWSNGKLVYDASDTAEVGSVLASSIHADGWKVYLGDETQLPDPTIEATVGVGQTPAYRGTAYVVFDHLDCPNGQIPQLSFEVVATGGQSTANPIFDEPPGLGLPAPTMASIMDNQAFQFASGINQRETWLVGPGWDRTSGSVFFNNGLSVSTFPPIAVQGGPYAMFHWFEDISYHLPMHIQVVSLDEKTADPGDLYFFTPGSDAGSFRPIYAAFDSVSGKFCGVADAHYARGTQITIMPSGVLTDVLDTGGCPMAFYDNVIYTCGVSSSITYLNSYDGDTGALLDSVSAGANVGSANLFVSANEHGVYVIEGDAAADTVDRRAWKVSAADGWVLLTSHGRYDNLAGYATTWWSNDDYGIVGPSGVSLGGTVTYRVIRYNAISTDDIAVSDIIESLCLRAGMSSGQIDTTDATDTVHGYAINQVASARSCIEPLQRTFFIDSPESDGKIKFLRRAGKSTVATIPFEDLGCVESGADAADPLALTRMQEAELPRSVALTYINYLSDYQPGTETARRQVTASVYDVTDQLPIATTSAHMATAAATLLYDAWAQRTTRKTKLWRTYAWLDVGDNVTIEYPKGTYTNKRLTKITDDGLMLDVEMVDSDPDVYTVVVPGVTPAGGQAGVEYASPTRLELLDIPLLRDADDDAGLYGALEGYSSSWNGAAVYVFGRAGDKALLGTVVTKAITGTAVTALADWPRNLIDEINSVDVQLASGTLSSTTRANILDSDANACLIGNEILQFRTATSLGSGQYRLTGLRRGRRGTEWAVADHAEGERFVLLQGTGMLRLAMELADRNKSLEYEAISVGQTAADGLTQNFTNTCAGLKPMAPANFDVAQDGSKLRMRWVRRSRYRDNWLAGNVPLAEASEAYQIDVFPPGGGSLTYAATESPLTIEAVAFIPQGLAAGRAAKFAISSGGYVYAMENAVMKMDATTLAVAASSAVNRASPSGLVISGSNLFAAFGGNPAGGQFGAIVKYDTALNMQGVAELPRTGDGLSEGHALDVCAGSLWVALRYSQIVRRIDPATLLPVASVSFVGLAPNSLASDGTYVWVICAIGTNLYRIDPASNTITATYALGTTVLSDLAVANGYAFVCGYDSQLHIYRLSDGQEMSHGMTGISGAKFSTYGNYVCALVLNKVYVIDATTLTERGTFTLNDGGYPFFSASLLSADRVLASSDYGGHTDYYDRTALGAGTQLNLYQMSSAVGRGFVAQRTL